MRYMLLFGLSLTILLSIIALLPESDGLPVAMVDSFQYFFEQALRFNYLIPVDQLIKAIQFTFFVLFIIYVVKMSFKIVRKLTPSSS